MDKLNWVKTAFCLFLLCAATTIAAQAQTFTTLNSFNFTDGRYANVGFTQADDGLFYGATSYGGAFNEGVIFKLSINGALTRLLSFDGANGINPTGNPIQATDGNFYGPAGGGLNGGGIIYKLAPNGTLTTLHDFCSQNNCADGNGPNRLIQATDGNLYGTTTSGGANVSCFFGAGCGTVFKITPGGALTTLYSFCAQANCTDGEGPRGPLQEGTDGNFYGVTAYGGKLTCNGGDGCGTIFKITPAGVLTTLYGFCSESACADGNTPFYGLIQGSDGNFYGTVSSGGNGNCPFGCGTVFKITSGGTFTIAHSFDSTDGDDPDSIVQGSDGNFYGTTVIGGTSTSCILGCGTVFELTPTGVLTILHSLDYGAGEGDEPSGLVQGTDGPFYGETTIGGTITRDCPSGCGTIFGEAVGLGPFVETQPVFGNVGAPVRILGNKLAGATSVTFNGTAATFTVVSPSLITTTVPTGATTGTVQVVTPSGTLSSNVPFRVLP
ncbi:MAG TPA: choice-of-anchor tandem repeat GloVer-containing protein [Terriglobia bacterium]|nr:choice-of-anchor tandem repeat GloVer-containing protein [Terriglobia bacterium]